MFLTEDTPANEKEREGNIKWDRRLNFEAKDEPHYYLSDQEWLEFLEKSGFELIDKNSFAEESPKKEEGIIRHSNYIASYHKEKEGSPERF